MLSYLFGLVIDYLSLFTLAILEKLTELVFITFILICYWRSSYLVEPALIFIRLLVLDIGKNGLLLFEKGLIVF